MLSKVVYLSGTFFSKGNFSSTAKASNALAVNLLVNMPFKVNNGVLHGLNLLRVASLLLEKNQSGGETQFDVLSSVLTVSGKQYQLRDLILSFGLLAATG